MKKCSDISRFSPRIAARTLALMIPTLFSLSALAQPATGSIVPTPSSFEIDKNAIVINSSSDSGSLVIPTEKASLPGQEAGEQAVAAESVQEALVQKASTVTPGSKQEKAKDLAQQTSAPAKAQESPVKSPMEVVQPTSLANSFAKLGGRLLGQSGSRGNAVVAPLGVASALGLVHLATQGSSAQEIGALFGKAGALELALPALLKDLSADKSPLLAANRVFLNKKLTPHVEPAFTQAARSQFSAEGVAIDMGASGAEAEVNRWVAEKTQGKIKDLLPEGTLNADSQAVLTNALYFKGQWATQFDPRNTQPRSFFAEDAGKEGVSVSTLSGKQTINSTSLEGGLQVYQLRYADPNFALTLIPTPEGKSLQQLEKELQGKSWSTIAQSLKPRSCLVELPKFSIVPKSVSLKKALQAQGVKTVFGKSADFSPLAGKTADLMLSDVFHAAGIIVDEAGTEAVSATAAVAVSKSLSLNPEKCSINRPFVFALVYGPEQTPIFMGHVSKPVQ